MSVHSKLVADLTAGEELLWCEEPGAMALFRAKNGVVSLLFFAVFFGIAFSTFDSFEKGSLLFVIIAVLVFGSFAYDLVASFWTLYGITTKRLVIVHPAAFSTVIESYYPMDIEFVKKTRRPTGSGNIVFAAVREKKGKRTETVEVGFFGIEKVDEVESMILDIRGIKTPNKAPEPTPGSVTPRAMDPKSK